MSRSSTLRLLSLSCLLGCVGSGYSLYIDRRSPLALNVVEIQSVIPIPIPALLVILGTLLMVWSLKRPTPERYSINHPTSHSNRTPKVAPTRVLHAERPKHSDSRQTDSVQPGGTWWTQVRSSCNQITLPPGARLSLDNTRPCPIVLHLEMAPPERCKRAIRAVGAWFSDFSIPPRLRIMFDHCPEGASPRHHMVNGALASEMDRAAFKVISDRDYVEVLFHRPDPRWKNPQSTG